MFRRLVGKPLAKLCLAAVILLLNVRVPFVKLYFKICVMAAILLLPQTSLLAQAPAPGCSTGTCSTGCNTCGPSGCQFFHCPPALKWCMEGKPRICFMPGCPKPICCPCEAPAWGYYQKCWTPWPWPPDWSHCAVPPLASQVVLPGLTPAGQAQLGDSAPVSRLPATKPPL
jgi:hypothetical protein